MPSAYPKFLVGVNRTNSKQKKNIFKKIILLQCQIKRYGVSSIINIFSFNCILSLELQLSYKFTTLQVGKDFGVNVSKM